MQRDSSVGVNFFQVAVPKLAAWVYGSALRTEDFKRCFGDVKVDEYCYKHAYRPDVVQYVIQILMNAEAERVKESICKV